MARIILSVFAGFLATQVVLLCVVIGLVMFLRKRLAPGTASPPYRLFWGGALFAGAIGGYAGGMVTRQVSAGNQGAIVATAVICCLSSALPLRPEMARRFGRGVGVVLGITMAVSVLLTLLWNQS